MERPEVIVNVACSLDGMIASADGALPLSTEEDWIRVHDLRNSVDAILVGVNTILKDNPLLTVRKVEQKPLTPLRVVLDTYCRIPPNAKILQEQGSHPTIIFTSNNSDTDKVEELQSLGVKIVRVSKKDNQEYLLLSEILRKLKVQFKVKKLLVEGGSKIITQFLKNNLVDKMYVFFSPVFVGGKKGVPLFNEETVLNMENSVKLTIEDTSRFGNGILVELKLKKDEL